MTDSNSEGLSIYFGAKLLLTTVKSSVYYLGFVANTQGNIDFIGYKKVVAGLTYSS